MRSAEPETIRWTDLRFEVQYIDGGLTALNTILWSLGSTAIAFGSAFFAVMFSILTGDATSAGD